ncbi:hypothetical protein WJX75_002354 [Coccomyxa subellipsoidea]|uniref:Histone chaperone domain-containing protein n=1 Tax=Coccomyxa subellipsoidea TaxID=248742 RepID=A0ABR2YZV3_9CHLO
MGDSSDDDMPLAARLAPVKNIKKEQPSKAVKAEKGNTEEPGPSSKSAPSKAKAEAKAHENGASKAEPARGKKIAGEAKGKAAAKAEKDATKPKKERKVFDMPGQTRETPDEADPLRKFYTSLKEQRPDSAIAKKWLLQTGLLPLEEAEEEVAKGRNHKSPAKPSRKSGSSAGGTTGRSGVSATAGTSRKANGPGRKPAANGGAKSGAKKRKAEWSEDEEESSSADEFNSDDDDVPLAQRGRAKAAAAKKPPAAKRPSKKSKDVAFADGGLGDPGSDSEDDIPIGQRMKK